MTAASTAAFSTGVDEANFAVAEIAEPVTSADRLEDVYRLPDCLHWLTERVVSRVALQFPDSLLPDSAAVSKRLQDARPALKTYVLADTSYGSCCVDEVAAAHVSAEALLHFGEACLSRPPDSLPVKFIFPTRPLPRLPTQGLQSLEEDVVILLYDLAHARHAKELLATLSGCEELKGRRLVEARPILEPSSAPWTVLGRSIELPKPETFATLFVGREESPLVPLWRLTHPGQAICVLQDDHWRPLTANFHRHLNRRLFLIEKIKDAKRIGLVAGALGVGGQVDAIERGKRLVAGAGKKAYVFSVGKLNPAKLANFADVDVFVLVACPFGLLLDLSDYYRPVVSVFELEVALNDARAPWHPGLGMATDFNDLRLCDMKLQSEQSEEDRAMDMSLVTGEVRPPTVAPTQTQQLLPYQPGEYLEGRSWKGLEEAGEGETAAEVTEGRSGIPMVYDNEPQ